MQVTLSLSRQPTPPSTSNMSQQDYIAAVDQVKEYIQAGDIFQLVLSHRFKRRTFADPFEIYRSVAPCTIATTVNSYTQAQAAHIPKTDSGSVRLHAIGCGALSAGLLPQFLAVCM